MPLLVKMMGITGAVAAVLASGMFWQIYSAWRADELTEQEENGRLLAKRIITHGLPLIRAGSFTEMQNLATELAAEIVGVSAIEVRDGQGLVLAQVGPLNAQAPVHKVLVPITGDAGGSICVSMDDTQLAAELTSLDRRLLLTILLALAIAMAGAWWVARVFTRPIHELVQNTRAVKAGDLGARAQVRWHDEIGELAAAFNEMAQELEEREAAKQQLLRKLISAEDEERKRVAHELHDHTGQALTALIAGLAALQPGPKSSQQLDSLLKLATQTLSEVHDLSRTLRPQALDDLGLEAALKKLCEASSQRLGLNVTCETVGFDSDSRLPYVLELALFRISQEAVTNAVRHGKARSIDLIVYRRSASVLTVIEDDGGGFDANGWHAHSLRNDSVGLLSMEHRAALLGGSLRIESRPGEGTSLFVEIPLRMAEHGPNSRA